MTLRSWIRRPPRHKRLQSGKRKGPPTLWYLKNVDGPQCHARQLFLMALSKRSSLAPITHLDPAFVPSNLRTFPARIVPSTTGRVLLPSLSHAIVPVTPG